MFDKCQLRNNNLKKKTPFAKVRTHKYENKTILRHIYTKKKKIAISTQFLAIV